MSRRSMLGALLSGAMLIAGCGGGGGSAGMPGPGPEPGPISGTLRVSLTDSPACGYDSVFVTVERVRVHQSGSAGEADAGWSEIVLTTPQRVDLLTLNNGTLLPLGQTELPAGTYSQMRLVLAANTAASPMANAIKPAGGAEVALTTPSGQQSGLKMNVNLAIAAGQALDVAIDFDACKSFVKAGNSGQYLLKPVLTVIPIVTAAGQRIVGFVHPSLISGDTTVSVQAAGTPLRSTTPDTSGRFTLYPMPAGTYDLVVTAAGRANAVMTGVPVTDAASTLIGSDALRINTPVSAASATVSGIVTVGGSPASTGAAVRATQTFTGGPTVEVAYAAANGVSGAYSMLLPLAPSVRAAYAAGASSFSFLADAATLGSYRLEAGAPGFASKAAMVLLPPNAVVSFAFP